MKVFMSWSGLTSHKIASVLKDWIPSVIQSVEPYVSSEDIDKGARWSTDIAKELEASAFGILCVTPDNVNAPWLNFEAGALGKSVDKSKVSPFLFGIKRSEVEGPILQFQSTIYEEEDLLKLIRSINKTCTENCIDEGRLDKSFNVWWPNLKRDLDVILAEISDREPQGAAGHKMKVTKLEHTEKILEEILELSRNNQKLLRSPEEIFPPAYFSNIIERTAMDRDDFLEHPIFDELAKAFFLLKEEITNIKTLGMEGLHIDEVEKLLNRIQQPLDFIERNRRRRLRRIRRPYSFDYIDKEWGD